MLKSVYSSVSKLFNFLFYKKMVKQNVTMTNLYEGVIIYNPRGDKYSVLAVIGQAVILGDDRGYYVKTRSIKALVENGYYMQFSSGNTADTFVSAETL